MKNIVKWRICLCRAFCSLLFSLPILLLDSDTNDMPNAVRNLSRRIVVFFFLQWSGVLVVNHHCAMYVTDSCDFFVHWLWHVQKWLYRWRWFGNCLYDLICCLIERAIFLKFIQENAHVFCSEFFLLLILKF